MPPQTSPHGQPQVPLGQDASCHIDYKEPGCQHILGRGQVSVALKHSQMHVEHIRQWLNQTSWHPRCDDKRPNSPCNTVSLLEMLVDFELTTGIRIGGEGSNVLTLAERSRVHCYYFRTITRIFTVRLNGITTTYTKAVMPLQDAASLAALGSPVLCVFGRKHLYTLLSRAHS